MFHPGIAHGLLVAHLPRPVTADQHDDPTWMWIYWLVAIPAMLVVAAIVTYGFERPLLRLRWSSLRRTARPVAERG